MNITKIAPRKSKYKGLKKLVQMKYPGAHSYCRKSAYDISRADRYYVILDSNDSVITYGRTLRLAWENALIT